MLKCNPEGHMIWSDHYSLIISSILNHLTRKEISQLTGLWLSICCTLADSVRHLAVCRVDCTNEDPCIKYVPTWLSCRSLWHRNWNWKERQIRNAKNIHHRATCTFISNFIKDNLVAKFDLFVYIHECCNVFLQ